MILPSISFVPLAGLGFLRITFSATQYTHCLTTNEEEAREEESWKAFGTAIHCGDLDMWLVLCPANHPTSLLIAFERLNLELSA